MGIRLFGGRLVQYSETERVSLGIGPCYLGIKQNGGTTSKNKTNKQTNKQTNTHMHTHL